MPKTRSAKKALRQNISRRKKNLERKIKIKRTIKRFKKLAAEGSTEEAKKYLATVYKTLDKMTKVKLLKKGKVSRLKSKLAKKLRNR